MKNYLLMKKDVLGIRIIFLNPCQIEIFWIADMDYQLIIQSNFNDKPDMEVTINGPYKMREFHSKVIAVLKNKRWMRNIKQNNLPRYEQFDTLGERMAIEIYRFVEMAKNSVFLSQGSGPHTLIGMALEDTWTYIHAGNVGELDHVQEIDKIILEIKQTAKTRSAKTQISKQPRSLTDDKYDGFGVHLFPPIVIDSVRKRSIEELIYDTYNIRIDNKIIDTRIDNRQIIVNRDGFIFVENDNKENALKILNLIMAQGAFYGFPLHAVREHELVMANYNKQELIMTDMQWNPETRRAYLINRDNA